MAIPRKGRRTISVDDIEYHYVVAFNKSERAVVRRSDGSGTCLFVLPFAILKPVNVAAAIKFANSLGWGSSSKQSDCWLVFDVDREGQSVFEHLPDDDFRVVTYSSYGEIPKIDASVFSDTRQWYKRPSPAENHEP